MVSQSNLTSPLDFAGFARAAAESAVLDADGVIVLGLLQVVGGDAACGKCSGGGES